MIFPLLLLVGAESLELPASVSIVIDPCVEVDEHEVRRLSAVELRTWRAPASDGALEVVVGCADGRQELRLTDRASGHVSVRSIDLSAEPEARGDANAKARELALAIAELLRRVEAPAPVIGAPRHADLGAPKLTEPVPAERGPSPAFVRTTVGVSGVVAGWTGGELLVGADLTGRARWLRWLVTELSLGGRRTRVTELTTGSIGGYGVFGGFGLGIRAFEARTLGVTFGARIAGEWLRYRVVDQRDQAYGHADVGAVSLAGTASVFANLFDPLGLTLDLAAGGALHSVVVRDRERSVSGLNGLLLSSALGFAVEL